MKTFSVRFYKRLILLVLALLIIIPATASVILMQKNAELRRQLEGETPGEGPSQPPAVGESVFDPTAEPIAYQELYPTLYGSAPIAAERLRETETVYLTFDCTPGENTGRILDLLDQYGVKATFFITAGAEESGQSWIKAIVDRGHSIGLRSYSGSYQQVYGSVAAFLEDFKAIYDLVYEVTGVRADIFRFPGGSINAYNSGIYQELNAEMLRRNFVFFDWDVSGEDTLLGGSSGEQVKNNVLSGMEGKDRGIIQLRDATGKESTPEALPGIIEGLRDRGYSFQPLTAEVLPVIFSYKNAP